MSTRTPLQALSSHGGPASSKVGNCTWVTKSQYTGEATIPESNTKITIRYTSYSGRSARPRKFPTLDDAITYAQDKVGKAPTPFVGCVLSDRGDKISVEGASLSDLFPESYDRSDP